GGPLVLHNAANRGLAARTGLPLFAIDLGMKLKISPRLTGGIAVIPKGGAPCGQCQVQGVDNGLVETLDTGLRQLACWGGWVNFSQKQTFRGINIAHADNDLAA